MEESKLYDLALLMFNIIKSNMRERELRDLCDQDGNPFDFILEYGEIVFFDQYSSAQHDNVEYEETIIKSSLLSQPVVYYIRDDGAYNGFAGDLEDHEDRLAQLIDVLRLVWSNIKESVKANNGSYFDHNNYFGRDEQGKRKTLNYEQMDSVFSPSFEKEHTPYSIS
jgi:hypothetical protein